MVHEPASGQRQSSGGVCPSALARLLLQTVPAGSCVGLGAPAGSKCPDARTACSAALLPSLIPAFLCLSGCFNQHGSERAKTGLDVMFLSAFTLSNTGQGGLFSEALAGGCGVVKSTNARHVKIGCSCRGVSQTTLKVPLRGSRAAVSCPTAPRHREVGGERRALHLVGAELCSTLAKNPFRASVLGNSTVRFHDFSRFGGVNAVTTLVYGDVGSGCRGQPEKGYKK